MKQSVHSAPAPTETKEVGRTNDSARTMAEILAVATHEFADCWMACLL